MEMGDEDKERFFSPKNLKKVLEQLYKNENFDKAAEDVIIMNSKRLIII